MAPRKKMYEYRELIGHKYSILQIYTGDLGRTQLIPRVNKSLMK